MKLTDKQKERIAIIAARANLQDLDSIKNLDVKEIKANRKQIADQLKAFDKIIAIMSPKPKAPKA